MTRRLVPILLLIVCLLAPLGVALAQVIWITDMGAGLPPGWGPINGWTLDIDNHFDYSGDVEINYDDELMCDGGLHFERYWVVGLPPTPVFDAEPPALARIGYTDIYTDGEYFPLRIHFAYWGRTTTGDHWDVEVATTDAAGVQVDVGYAQVCTPGDPTCTSDRVGIWLPQAEAGDWIAGEWRGMEMVLQAPHNGYVQFSHAHSEINDPTLENGFVLSGLFIGDAELEPFPPDFCGWGVPTPTPYPTRTSTPTPTDTPTGGWTPSPTVSLTPTSTPGGTTTPGYTPTGTPTTIPFQTWTPRSTSTPFPTPTSVPVTPAYMTPIGGWGTPVIPTLAPLNTLAPLPGWTPDATYEAEEAIVVTRIAQAMQFYTSVLTASNWAMTYTLDASSFLGTTTDTGTITNPLFFVSEITKPIGYTKGVIRFIPNLARFMLFYFAVFLWMVTVSLIRPAYRIIVWVIDKLERLWHAILDLPFL